jgi:hypothetical protein
MKASELRIGNLVDLNSEITKIFSINEKGINHTIDNWGHFPNLEFESFESIQPIPLTEEWLFKFGFSATDYKKGYIGIDHKAGGIITDFVLTYPLVNGLFQKYFIWEHSKFKYQELKHVHQLQNLYYSLTGEELTLKNTHND